MKKIQKVTGELLDVSYQRGAIAVLGAFYEIINESEGLDPETVMKITDEMERAEKKIMGRGGSE